MHPPLAGPKTAGQEHVQGFQSPRMHLQLLVEALCHRQEHLYRPLAPFADKNTPVPPCIRRSFGEHSNNDKLPEQRRFFMRHQPC